MKGYALTPPQIVDLMVEKLFRRGAPAATARILDPGCGTGVSSMVSIPCWVAILASGFLRRAKGAGAAAACC